MNALKKLVTTKPKTIDLFVDKEEVSDDNENLQLTFFQKGFGDSKNANGNFLIFKASLENIFQDFKQKCRNDETEQKKLNTPIIEEKVRQESELNKRNTAKLIKIEQNDNLDKDIQEIENDIAHVKVDPEKYGIDANKKPKTQFYIGLVLLVPISIYLVVFYLSASYSAFFKDFESKNVINAIFDAQAFSNSLKAGVLEAIFVFTIPFAFMGLGYLIHMFLKEKKYGWIKVLALLVVTFIFDGILAFLIENKIYEFNKTLMSEPFNLRIAVQHVEFWGIIFAGFVVYVIWGLVFDFIMKEHENIDKIKIFRQSLIDKKQNKLNQKDIILKQLRSIEVDIIDIKGKINQLQSRIDGFIFPNRKYLVYHAEYSKGWYLAISKEIALPKLENNKLISSCQHISTEHLEKHGVQDEDNESIIYS